MPDPTEAHGSGAEDKATGISPHVLEASIRALPADTNPPPYTLHSTNPSTNLPNMSDSSGVELNERGGNSAPATTTSSARHTRANVIHFGFDDKFKDIFGTTLKTLTNAVSQCANGGRVLLAPGLERSNDPEAASPNHLRQKRARNA